MAAALLQHVEGVVILPVRIACHVELDAFLALGNKLLVRLVRERNVDQAGEAVEDPRFEPYQHLQRVLLRDHLLVLEPGHHVLDVAKGNAMLIHRGLVGSALLLGRGRDALRRDLRQHRSLVGRVHRHCSNAGRELLQQRHRLLGGDGGLESDFPQLFLADVQLRRRIRVAWLDLQHGLELLPGILVLGQSEIRGAPPVEGLDEAGIDLDGLRAVRQRIAVKLGLQRRESSVRIQNGETCIFLCIGGV